MKAVIIEKFGGRDQLKIASIPTPEPAEGEILVEVTAAGVNPVDWKIREGYLKNLLPHQFPVILGWDVAGTVKAVGKAVIDFKPADRVYAYCRKPVIQWGSYAEFIVLEASSAAPIPRNVTVVEAASFPLTALTAWQSLFDFAQLTKGQSVLIHGGAGGVGGIAIQLAKTAGATVLTTASPRNHGYVKELGAIIAIDYTKSSLEESVRQVEPEGVDTVFDCVGGEALSKSYPLVKKGGKLVSIVAPPPDAEEAGRRGIETGYVFVSPNGAQLRQLSQLIESQKIRPPFIEELPLEQAANAHEKSETHRTRGKIVLRVR